MKKGVKNFFKVFGISIGVVAGALALVLLGLFIFGAFNKPEVPIESMYFVVNDQKTDDNFYLIDKDCYIKLVSYPENATEEEVTITVTQGSDVVTISEVQAINKPIRLTVEQEEITIGDSEPIKVNKGGEVKLSATCDKNQLVDASCTIYVDTLVEEYNIKLTNGTGTRYYLNETNNVLISYQKDNNGEYGYNEETDEYVLKAELPNGYNGSYYTALEQNIYPGTEFYVELDTSKTYPLNSINTYSKMELTKYFKTFEISADKYVTTVEMDYTGLIPRAKITVNEVGEFYINSTLINSYKNVQKKKDLDASLSNNPTVEDMDQYNSILSTFTLNQANEINIVVNGISLNGFTATNTTFTFNEKESYSFTNSDLGLSFIAPSNSNYTNDQLNYRFKDVSVQTGYESSTAEIDGNISTEIAGKNITLTDEFIYATTRVEEDIDADNNVTYNFYLNVECYKQKIGKNYIILSINQDEEDQESLVYNILLEVNITKNSVPAIQITENNNRIDLDLTLSANAGIYYFTEQDVFTSEDLQQLDIQKYKVVYMLCESINSSNIATNNTVIKNNGGVLPIVYKEDANGSYGINNGEYFLIKDGEVYVGKRFIKTFTIELEEIGNAVIRAFIIKTDFAGNLINFEEDASGEYGYYRGVYDLIENIEKNYEITYNGTRYKEGMYQVDGISSSNAISVNVKQKLEVTDFDLYQDNDGTYEKLEYGTPTEKEIEATKVGNIIDLTLYQGDSLYIVLTTNNQEDLLTVSGDLLTFTSASNTVSLSNYQLLNENLYGVQLFATQPCATDPETGEIIPIRVTIDFKDEETSAVTQYVINVTVKSLELESLSLKVNNQEEIEVSAQINDADILWRANGTDDVLFSFEQFPKRAVIKYEDIEFLYYSVYDINNPENNVIDNSILKCHFETDEYDNQYIESEFLNAGSVYVVMKYGDVYSNAILVNVTTPDVKITVVASNVENKTLNGENITAIVLANTPTPVNDDDIDGSQEILLNSSSYFSLNYNDVNNNQNLNEDLLTFGENITLLDINGQPSGLTVKFTCEEISGLYYLKVSSQISSTVYVKLSVSTLFGSDLGYIYFKLVPDVKVVLPDSSTLVTVTENIEYTLELNLKDASENYTTFNDITEILTLTNNEGENYEIFNVKSSDSQIINVNNDIINNTYKITCKGTGTAIVTVYTDFGYEVKITITVV